MLNRKAILQSLGNTAAIPADGRRPVERREVSRRWLAGTALTGLTSTVLMGVALFAAMDGRQQLAVPAEALVPTSEGTHIGEAVARGGRVVGALKAARASNRAVLELSTVAKENDRDVIRKQPYAHVRMQLAASSAPTTSYPKFDPTAVLLDAPATVSRPVEEGSLYAAQVETEVRLKTASLSTMSGLRLDPERTLEEVEASVRSDGALLLDGAMVATAYVDPQRFSDVDEPIDLGTAARVVEQNVSFSTVSPIGGETEQFAEDIIKIGGTTTIAAALRSAGYPAPQSENIAATLLRVLGESAVDAGDFLRMGLIQRGQELKVVRASFYRGETHRGSIALDDSGRFVAAAEPTQLDTLGDGGVTIAAAQSNNLPKVYDGLYRAALSYGMTLDLASTVIRTVAPTVDLQAPLRPSDSLEAFFSSQEDGRAEEGSELLYFKVRFGDRESRFYRFRDPTDGQIGYFDENGKSLRQFLLRNPVPTAVANSSYGMRQHPILGFARMHTGVDYPAPRGTPILSSGDGTVLKAGWDTGGYGNQTLIRHSNGYVSSYSHQSAIAKAVVAGAKVRQGQVIGYIGSTGMATGSHLHYELLVNGRRVDPFKVRLPTAGSLKDNELAKFQAERLRIDTLLETPPKSSSEDT